MLNLLDSTLTLSTTEGRMGRHHNVGEGGDRRIDEEEEEEKEKTL